MSPSSQPRTGLDRLLADPSLIPPGRNGLLTHFAAVGQDLGRGVDALVAAGIDIACMITPEHGYWGAAQAGLGGGPERDEATGLPVLDSYRVHGEDLDRLLSGAGIDRVVVDLRDIGCRFYTYTWSMTDVMAACARIGLPVTVLDRPAPLPTAPLGPGLDPACASFVGRFGVPLRHGMRLGEIARLVAAEQIEEPLDLQVLDAPGADGSTPWVPPSPNMPTLTTVALYPGIGLLEGLQLGEGRGTTAPFELFGAPWCGPELAAALRELDLPGVAFREAVFLPTHSSFVGELVHGAQVHLTAPPEELARDRGAFDPLRIGHAIIAAVARLYPERPLWRAREAPGPPAFIDLLWGSSVLREGVDDGATFEEILAASPAPDLGPA